MELWIIFAVVAAAAQSVRFAVQKVLAGGALSPAAATWARFLFSAPLVALLAYIYLRATGAVIPAPTPAFWKWAALGGVAQILATICTVSLFQLRSFAIGITFKKTEVLLTAVVGFILLDDMVSFTGALALLLGFAGVLILSDPPQGGSVFNRASGLGVLSGVFFALSAVAYRGATLDISTGDPILTGGLTLAVVTAGQTLVLGLWLAVREPGQITATLAAWRQASVVGVFSMVGSWGWFAAFSLANAAYVFAVGQVELIFSILLGLLWFRESLRVREVIGMIVLTGSILAIAFVG